MSNSGVERETSLCREKYERNKIILKPFVSIDILIWNDVVWHTFFERSKLNCQYFGMLYRKWNWKLFFCILFCSSRCRQFARSSALSVIITIVYVWWLIHFCIKLQQRQSSKRIRYNQNTEHIAEKTYKFLWYCVRDRRWYVLTYNNTNNNKQTTIICIRLSSK